MSVQGFCTACCRTVTDFAPGGQGGRRPRARCPRCNALERHRFLAILLDHLAPRLHDHARVLDIAPSRFVTRRLSTLRPAEHVRIDLDPGADTREVDVCASLTQLPFGSGAFDLALCYHVLEHIPDDATAMRELGRVLHDDGIALVQVPYRSGRGTDEDPSATPTERMARFGQADHVRWYGNDFEERLVDAGLAGYRIQPPAVVGDALVHLCGLNPNENVWVLRRSRSSPGTVATPGGLTLPSLAGIGALALEGLRSAAHLEDHTARVKELEAELATTRKRVAATRADVDRLRKRYERLRYHPVMDLIARVSRPVRRLLDRR